MYETDWKNGKRIVGNKLAPHQFSLGMPSGSQISVKHSNDAFTNGDTLISLDQKNAFNSTRLIDIYNGLVKYCPELIPFFRFECEKAMEIEDFEGNIVGLSHTGSTQGNGAAMLLYCCAAQLIFIKIDSRVKEIENEYKNEHPELEIRPSFVKASADDCTINGDPNIMALLAYELSDIYKAHNADLCITKCVIFGLNLYSSDVPIPAGYKQSTEGAKSLGCPVGTDQYRKDFFEKTMSEYSFPTLGLSKLAPQSTLHLAQKCFDTRPNYKFFYCQINE